MQQEGAGPTPVGYTTPPGGQPHPGGVPPNEPKSVLSLVLGILGIVVCGVVAPFAWNIGKTSLSNIRAEPGRWSGEGMAMAGYVLGIIGTILLGLFVIFIVVYFIILGAILGSAM